MLAGAPASHGAARPPAATTRRLGIVFLAVLVAAIVAGGQVVVAHTGVDFTLPTDGAAVGEPVREVTVAFDDPVTLIGPGFEVLDPQGNVMTPFVVTDDDVVFRLQIDPPMGGGEAAVRYEVRAEDGHTISGGFSFTILADAPIPTTTSTTTTTTTASTTGPAADPTTTLTSTSTPDTTLTVAPVTAVPPASASTGDGGTSTDVYVAIAAVVVVIAGAFLLFRSRAGAT